MKLVASLVVRSELGRYLESCIEHLLEFCDEIRVLNDGSTDGSDVWLVARDDRIQVADLEGATLFGHEGAARQALLDFTLTANPTHILAIDADELVSDGAAVRAACEADEGPGAWTLSIEEVWKATPDALWTRQDGSWRSHRVPCVYRVPARPEKWLRIEDKQLACGREPIAIRKLWSKAPATGASLLHLGWTCEADRAARYQRYVEADGGRFHASAHLRSIMLPDRRVRLARREWPAALEPWKARILERANMPVAA